MLVVMCRWLCPLVPKARTRGQGGQVLVEMALMGLFLALLLAGLIDLWRAHYTYIVVTDAAAEGAAYGAAFPGATTDQIKARAAGASAGLVTISTDQVDVTADAQTITVTVSYPHVLTTPFLQSIVGGTTVPITQRAVKPILD